MTTAQRRSAFVFLVAAGTLIASPGFSANTTTWGYTAVVRNYINLGNSTTTVVPPPEFSAAGVVPGVPLLGEMTFDLDSIDENPSPDSSLYNASVVDGKMNVSATSVQFEPSQMGLNFIAINNPAQSPGLRGMSAFYRPADIAGFNFTLVGLQLYGPIGSVFPTDDIPVVPPLLSTLAPFDTSNPSSGTRVLLSAIVPSGQWYVVSELVELSQIPEPSVICLAMLGWIAFPVRARRR